ncbi:MAG: carbohydrate ABC transporter permease [Lachnospiraceae bacterium]|nr:carbohydrate ABC transporter permease [Lachnospiraceae bacterium]
MKSKVKSGNDRFQGMGDRIFNIVVTLIAVAVCIIAFYPMWYVLIASFSRPFYVSDGSVVLLPGGFTLAAYIRAFNTSSIWTGYLNTIIITVGGVAVNMFFSVTLAYALSKKELPFKRFFTLFVAFTMWFSAGMLPLYQTIRSYHLTNSHWGIMMSFAINVYNVFILKSFFEQVPGDFEEAARIDGANTLTVFAWIYLPLSKAALATVTLFYMVSRWNGYFWASVLLTDDDKQPLQVVLKKLIVDQTNLVDAETAITPDTLVSGTTVAYAIIVVATVPMLVVYPFIQKYFKSGVTLGGVKG